MKPVQLSKGQRSGIGSDDKVIIVYVCPACGNYYGSSTARDLEKQWNIAPPEAKDAGKRRSLRSRCPVCGQDRIKRYARLVPLDEQAEAERKTRFSLVNKQEES